MALDLEKWPSAPWTFESNIAAGIPCIQRSSGALEQKTNLPLENNRVSARGKEKERDGVFSYPDQHKKPHVQTLTTLSENFSKTG